MTPDQFVAKWRNIQLKEKAGYVEHFTDLCRVVDHPTPAEADPAGHFFAFEAGATKQGGGQGWADVWYKGHFAIEYKGPDGNLEKAYAQLLQYRESLQNPPLLIVCNLQEIIIHTNFTNSVKAIITLTLDDLLTPAGLTALRNLFYHPEAFRPQVTAAQVTEEAATHFARLAMHLGKWGYPPHAIAHYSIRLLFCLFAEDIALLPHNLFTRIVENGRQDARRFNQQTQQLFAAMAEGADFGEHAIRWFNGGLFDGADVLEMDSQGVDLLQHITQLDWSAIEPSIFGTLFTRSLDPDQRARLGAQYTSKADIVLIVEPVLMAPLRKAWKAVQVEAQQLAQKRDRATTRAAATQANQALNQCILAFAAKLATTRVLDPACGSGNFLYVALRLLLDLWKEVALFAGELGLPMLSPLPGLAPSPAQLYGIEINDYAHELAQATVWIGYLQWLHDNGYGFPSDPVLKPLDTIQQMDAILAFDEEGKPVEPAWPAAKVIVGNPPFLGGGKIRGELGDKYTDKLFNLYGDRLPNFSDLVCYWFEKSRKMVELRQVQRAGLLATQGIRGGANRTVLDRIKQTGDIFWALSDRNWILNGAAVHVSMIGFDDGRELLHSLDDRPVTTINADLTTAVDVTRALILNENVGLSFQGPSPKAPFDVDDETAKLLLASPVASRERNMTDVVRPVVSAVDIGQGNRGKWTIDFGLLELSEAELYPAALQYVKDTVLPVRSKRRDDYRGMWWQYARPRPDMRAALTGKERFIATPRVSKYRLFVWLPSEYLANDGTIVISREDDYMFGVLHAWPHEIWSRAKGTQLREAESGCRYTPTTTFETFPFPWPPGHEPLDDPRVQAIAAAAQALVAQRDAWLNPPGLPAAELKQRTLTNLYNARPDWLDAAHHTLDAAVCAAYGWPADLSDEEVLARLLALNLERAQGEGLART
jgi:hypothetical protein